jgi:rifampicin phosphotransferase
MMRSTVNASLYLPSPGTPVPSPAEIGGKAHNLAHLTAAGLEVPHWFAVPVAVFESVVAEGPGAGGDPDPAARQAAVRALELPAELKHAIREALGQTGLSAARLAVRSSAAAEDAAAASFAGQFDTVLNVRGEAELFAALTRVWGSAFNPHALAYGQAGAMSVIVQEMVDAGASGVAFGADPVSGDEATVVVSAVYGLGEGLVSGALDADTWRLRAGGGPAGHTIVERRIAAKREAVRARAGGGTRLEPVPDSEQGEPVLTDDELVRIGGAVAELGRRLGAPQDVEWAVAGGDRRLVLLQTRPITATGWVGERRLWDNSNIVESYSGVTTPLTFSFAASVYEDVYRQFCAVVGVSGDRIDRNRHVFANMLGLIRGRVYYNLHNWYRVLALLPGFSLNRAFMERMMGVSEKLSDPPAFDAADGKLGDAARVARMVQRLVRENRRLRREVPAFHAHVGSVLDPLAETELNTWSADRLLALYRRLEDELLRKWQTPLVNDFFAMIWFGLLGRLVETWLPDEPATLVNDLLTHEGGIVSTEPSRRVAGLADAVRADAELLRLFEAENDDIALLAAVEGSFPAFEAQLHDYLLAFGDRCMNELKLETVTLRDDPGFLVRTLRGYLSGGVRSPDPTAVPVARREAERRVHRRLGGLRRRIFDLVLHNARARVRDRENLRFERTRVFGVVRRIFLGFGHHLVRVGLLDEPRDVFHLTVAEIFSHVDGTSTAADLRVLAALRRDAWNRYADTPPPPDRFESIGPPELGRWVTRGPAAPAGTSDGALRGIGCCPGIVRAPVRIVRDPRDVGELTGRILVAERTDPGWTLLFPQARGILVERGSLLSHSAIVAREMGIPCVVAVPGLLATLEDGQEVEMDGTAGTVLRVERQ